MNDKRYKTKSRRVRILLAEDDDAMRTLILEALARDNYEVVSANDGVQLGNMIRSIVPEANEDSAEKGFDIIISDVRMPGRTALEVLAEFRKLAQSIPFVLITAFSDPETRDEAKRLGAAAVFDKPFDIAELKKTIRHLVPTKKNTS